MQTSPSLTERPPAEQDPELFQRLYAEHASALHAYARRFTDAAQAEDIVQETFLRAWRHRGRLAEDGRPVRPWLKRSARNLLTDAARKERCRPVLVADDGVHLTTLSVEGGLDRVLDQQVLLPALRRLPAGQLVVLVESVLCGASLATAAQRLGIPAGTARSRLHYALRTLRRDLSALDAART
jgi:RNA polymerase sigma-70 factor (ECF subfamily)